MKLVATTYRSHWKMSNVQTSNITIAFTQSRASSTVYNLKIYLNLPVQTSNITIAFTQSRASSTVYNLKIYLNLPVQTSKSIFNLPRWKSACQITNAP